MIPAWVEKYIRIRFVEHGRTHEGCDCWGLVKLILEEQFLVQGLPDFSGDYVHTREAGKISKLCLDEAQNWKPIRLTQEAPGDVILLRIMGLPVHVGVVVTDGWMVHCEHGKDTALESYLRTHWINRIEGFYRHV
jgi:cell wall-associated NlpC family hydrolase